MASRHTGLREAPVSCPPTMPDPNPMAVFENSNTLGPGDEITKAELKREADRQTLFQKVANDILGSPNGYRQVQVLIIRWDESIDQFKGHTKEIERLERIFSKGFGYSCRIACLNVDRKPQVGLNYEITRHIYKHDNENTLLIIYYTGHGSQVVAEASKRLELSAQVCPIYASLPELMKKSTERSGASHGFAPTAFWDVAENPLRDDASGDALVILDCCCASTAALRGRNEVRTYQLLAASATEGNTNGPGEKSFTTALCDSLEELLEESKGESFPVIKLQERINTKRTEQSAVIWDRLERYKRSIKLGRLVSNPERDESFQREVPEKASLLVRLSLATDELQDTNIECLARQLPEACREAGVHVRRMEWVKMEHRHPKEVFRKAVKTTIRMNRRQSNPDKQQQRRKSQELKKRTRSESSAFSAPKRQARDGSSSSAESKVFVGVEALKNGGAI